MLKKYDEKNKEEMEKLNKQSSFKYEMLDCETDKYVKKYSHYTPVFLKFKHKIMDKTCGVHTRVKGFAEARIEDDFGDSAKTVFFSVVGCIAGAAMIALGGMALAQNPATAELVSNLANLADTSTDTMSKAYGGSMVGAGGVIFGVSALNTKTAARAIYAVADKNESKNEIKRKAICEALEEKGVDF